jgi:hypothetical protein
MIELKKGNFITGDTNSVSYGLNKIIKFLELDGRNIILLTTPKVSYTNPLKYLATNKVEYKNFDQFQGILNDSSVLFRVDLIVADLWHLRSLPIEFKKALDNCGIQYIIASKRYHYTECDDITDYHVKRESISGSYDSSYIITDKINGWTSNLDDLAKSYVRDKKIDGIIGDEDFI